MSSKMSIMVATWGRWLDRYVTPTNLRGNDGARQDEIDAHIRVISRYAPDRDTEDWMGRLTETLDRAMKTSAWPRVAEIEAACMAIRASDAQLSTTGPTDPTSHIDPFQIAARRIQEGQPVGEGYLWGRSAVVLLRRGLVTQAQVHQRREAHIAGMAEVWPPEIIAERVSDLEAAHAHGIKLEDGARREWMQNRDDAQRRAAQAKAQIAANRIPSHQPDHGRMQEAYE